MDNKTNKILKDILICIENIDKYLGENKIFSEYDTNYLYTWTYHPVPWYTTPTCIITGLSRTTDHC